MTDARRKTFRPRLPGFKYLDFITHHGFILLDVLLDFSMPHFLPWEMCTVMPTTWEGEGMGQAMGRRWPAGVYTKDRKGLAPVVGVPKNKPLGKSAWYLQVPGLKNSNA